MVQALFIHQNFPGQWRHLAPMIAKRPGARVVGLGERQNVTPPGVNHLRYPPPDPAGDKTHRYLRPVESAVRRGQNVVRALITLQKRGFVPDIVYCHPGWGEGLYLRDVFPDARIVHYCEYYYHARGGDIGFDPSQPVNIDEMARVRTLNMTQLQSLETADWCMSPTLWQRSRYPRHVQDMTSVVHEGVDATFATPVGTSKVALPDGFLVERGQEVVTFVSRNLEPYRGFDVFMRALPEILARRPNAHAVIVGGEERGYGRTPADGRSWKAVMMEEVGARLDPARVHFTGRIPHEGLVSLFRASAAHVYYTYPFVLSWSLVEAMGCEALIIGSDTPTLSEVIRHGENGLLLPFFDHQRMADAVVDALAHPDRYVPLRQAARRTMLEKFDLHAICLPQQVKLFDAVLAGRPGTDVIPMPETPR
ncbi:glycosyltransferase [Neoroseomonas oryzicola]|uniref:Glycosyltransferase n=1 Tax=Neoroseomonas oryzicola TaxID=535904 RepID=A0A9X9WI55_9PROT|nr:glycosyltransferase [Neoroseomonas oryzicola]NKE19432.1 glycosyltransferase [Neoroseomonas oryzicola]